MALPPEAKLMTSWVVGNVADTLITHIGVAGGAVSERMPINAAFLSEGRFDAQAVSKLGLTILLAGFYALAHQFPEGKLFNRKVDYRYVAQRVIGIGNVIIWGGVLWNIGQVIASQIGGK